MEKLDKILNIFVILIAFSSVFSITISIVGLIYPSTTLLGIPLISNPSRAIPGIVQGVIFAIVAIVIFKVIKYIDHE